jgi:hypothetical protein
VVQFFSFTLAQVQKSIPEAGYIFSTTGKQDSHSHWPVPRTPAMRVSQSQIKAKGVMGDGSARALGHTPNHCARKWKIRLCVECVFLAATFR